MQYSALESHDLAAYFSNYIKRLKEKSEEKDQIPKGVLRNRIKHLTENLNSHNNPAVVVAKLQLDRAFCERLWGYRDRLCHPADLSFYGGLVVTEIISEIESVDHPELAEVC